MAKKFVSAIDLGGNELQGATVQVLASAPSSPSAGRVYYDSTLGALRCYNGSAWTTLSGGSSPTFNHPSSVYYLPGVVPTGKGSNPIYGGTLLWCPILPPAAMTIDRVLTHVVQYPDVGKQIRVALASADSGFQPASLIGQVVVAATSNGAVETTVSWSLSANQPYVVGIQVEADYLGLAYFLANNLTGMQASIDSNPFVESLTVSRSAGTISTPPAWTNKNYSNDGFKYPFALRVS